MFGDDDVRAFTDTFGDPIAFKGVTVSGIVDAYDAELTPLPGVDLTLSRRVVDVTVPSDAWSPMPKRGDAITVDGVAMTVLHPEQQRDGAFTHLFAAAS